MVDTPAKMRLDIGTLLRHHRRRRTYQHHHQDQQDSQNNFNFVCKPLTSLYSQTVGTTMPLRVTRLGLDHRGPFWIFLPTTGSP